MKKTVSTAIFIFLTATLLTLCGTSFSFAGDMKNVIPEAPESLSAVNGATGVNVTWSGVPDTAGYKIYRADSHGEAVEIADVRGFAINSFTDKTAKSGEAYSYSVRAYNAYNEGTQSEKCDVIYLKQPTLKTVKVAYEGIELKWNKCDGAESYTIYRKNGTSHKKIAVLSGVNGCSFVDKNVKDGEKYTYRVTADKDIYKSSANTKTSLCFVSAPVLKDISNHNGYVKISWRGVANADGYAVYRRTAQSSWERIANTSNATLQYKDTKVKNGVTYIYTVRAKSQGNYSGYNVNGIYIQYIKSPDGFMASNKDNNIVVKWSAVSGADSYTVYRKTGSSVWANLGKVKSASYIDKNVKNGTKYTYTVKAVAADGTVSGYNSSGVQCLALLKPTGLKATYATEGIKISWNKVSTAVNYYIYRKTSADTGWKRVGIVDKTVSAVIDKSVKEGVTYYYTVKQVNGKFAGSYDSKGVKITFVTAPEIEVNHSPKGVVVSWDKSPVGTGYSIERKAAGESAWTKLATVKGSSKISYTDKKPVFGVLNYYRVRVNGVSDATLVSKSASLYGIDPSKPMVALTYDDGPYDVVTNRILDVLEKNNARATFFIVGSRVSSYKSCLVRSVSLGCEIGNHTYNHTILTSVSPEKIKSEIESTNNAVKKITGVSPVVVRAPGGSVNSKVKSNVAYPLFNWSVDTLDWKNRNSSSVVSSIKNNVRDGSIVLMHDLYGSTATASEHVIPWLIKEGYQLVTVSELMAVKGIDAKAGNLYTCAY